MIFDDSFADRRDIDRMGRAGGQPAARTHVRGELRRRAGDPKLPNAYSRLHYNVQYLAKILERIAATAPAGADLKSWRY
jgi:hypothetical protein